MPEGAYTMTVEENKAVMNRIIDEVLNGRNLALTEEVIAPDYVYRGALGKEFHGPEGFKQDIISLITAFPDYHLKVEDMFGEGDMVVSRITGSGTHTGEFMGIAPTGKHFTCFVILIVRIVDGKEVASWSCSDLATVVQQLSI